jgi:hypothetical protein
LICPIDLLELNPFGFFGWQRRDFVNARLLNFGGHGEGSGEAEGGLRSATPNCESAKRGNVDGLHSRVNFASFSMRTLLIVWTAVVSWSDGVSDALCAANFGGRSLN